MMRLLVHAVDTATLIVASERLAIRHWVTAMM